MPHYNKRDKNSGKRERRGSTFENSRSGHGKNRSSLKNGSTRHIRAQSDSLDTENECVVCCNTLARLRVFPCEHRIVCSNKECVITIQTHGKCTTCMEEIDSLEKQNGRNPCLVCFESVAVKSVGSECLHNVVCSKEECLREAKGVGKCPICFQPIAVEPEDTVELSNQESEEELLQVDQQTAGETNVVEESRPANQTEDVEICVICIDKKAIGEVIPCGHIVVCGDQACLDGVIAHKKCPVCRAKADKIIVSKENDRRSIELNDNKKGRRSTQFDEAFRSELNFISLFDRVESDDNDDEDDDDDDNFNNSLYASWHYSSTNVHNSDFGNQVTQIENGQEESCVPLFLQLKRLFRFGSSSSA